MKPLATSGSAGAMTSDRTRAWRAARSLAPWWWTVLGAVVVAVICLAQLQSVLHDSVYYVRYHIVETAMRDAFPYLLLVGAPTFFAIGVAELTRDRGWVNTAARASMREFVVRVVYVAFLRGGFGFLFATVLIVAGAYAISFEPNIFYVSESGPSFAPDLSIANEKYMISDSSGAGMAGILSPVGGVSLVLFYATLAIWTGMWGGIVSVFAVVCVCVLPLPRIALLAPLIWIIILERLFSSMDLGLGAISPFLALFPTLSSQQPLVTPLLASALFVAPMVLLAVWGWRNFEKLAAFR